VSRVVNALKQSDFAAGVENVEDWVAEKDRPVEVTSANWQAEALLGIII
jgi:hypothetical protein